MVRYGINDTAYEVRNCEEIVSDEVKEEQMRLGKVRRGKERSDEVMKCQMR